MQVEHRCRFCAFWFDDEHGEEGERITNKCVVDGPSISGRVSSEVYDPSGTWPITTSTAGCTRFERAKLGSLFGKFNKKGALENATVDTTLAMSQKIPAKRDRKLDAGDFHYGST